MQFSPQDIQDYMSVFELTEGEVHECIVGCNSIDFHTIWSYFSCVRIIREYLDSRAPTVAVIIHALEKSNGDTSEAILALSEESASNSGPGTHPPLSPQPAKSSVHQAALQTSAAPSKAQLAGQSTEPHPPPLPQPAKSTVHPATSSSQSSPHAASSSSVLPGDTTTANNPAVAFLAALQRWNVQIAEIQEVLSRNAPGVAVIVDALEQNEGVVNDAIWALSESTASSSGTFPVAASSGPSPPNASGTSRFAPHAPRDAVSPSGGASVGSPQSVPASPQPQGHPVAQSSGSSLSALNNSVQSPLSASAPHPAGVSAAPPSPQFSTRHGDDDVKTLWPSYLKHANLASVMGSLRWGRKKDDMYLSRSITHVDHPCYQFVVQLTGDNFVDVHRIDRIVMVGLPADTIDTFISSHKREGKDIRRNEKLQSDMSSDPAFASALERLKQSCIPDDQSGSRIVLGWHGTSIQCVEKICRDGLRPLRTTDCGFFGTGSYFALEASYAARYCRCDESEEMAIVLFAISFTQVMPI
ncbi:Hypothetical protein, putative, partial [Bodo saltans]